MHVWGWAHGQEEGGRMRRGGGSMQVCAFAMSCPGLLWQPVLSIITKSLQRPGHRRWQVGVGRYWLDSARLPAPGCQLSVFIGCVILYEPACLPACLHTTYEWVQVPFDIMRVPWTGSIGWGALFESGCYAFSLGDRERDRETHTGIESKLSLWNINKRNWLFIIYALFFFLFIDVRHAVHADKFCLPWHFI